MTGPPARDDGPDPGRGALARPGPGDSPTPAADDRPRGGRRRGFRRSPPVAWLAVPRPARHGVARRSAAARAPGPRAARARRPRRARAPGTAATAARRRPGRSRFPGSGTGATARRRTDRRQGVAARRRSRGREPRHALARPPGSPPRCHPAARSLAPASRPRRRSRCQVSRRSSSSPPCIGDNDYITLVFSVDDTGVRGGRDHSSVTVSYQVSSAMKMTSRGRLCHHETTHYVTASWPAADNGWSATVSGSLLVEPLTCRTQPPRRRCLAAAEGADRVLE